MEIKDCIVILLLIFGLFSIFHTVNADENIYLNIHILGEDAQNIFGNKVIVAGIWHNIDLTIETQVSQEIKLVLYQGISIPSAANRDETNYYEWRYDKISDLWTDENGYQGYSYINESNCKNEGNYYSFCIGLKDTFPDIDNYHENWTLEIFKDGAILHTESVTIEKPMIGIAKSHDDIISFQIDPFTEKNIQNEEQYFIIINTGNVPLKISFNYETYNEIIKVSNSGKKLSSDESYNHYVSLFTRSWKPGILSIEGSTSASIPEDLVITSAPIVFNTNITTLAASLELSVGHSNYRIQEIKGSHIVFQYEEEINMRDGEVRDIIVYLSGEGIVDLAINVDGEYIKILKIFSEDQEGSPMTILSKNTSEYAVTIRVEALKENMIGTLTYRLEIDGKIETYQTSISIGPPIIRESLGELRIPSTAIFIVICFVIVIIYMISNQIKHKRR